jgi:lipid-A-disaccharide synthase
LPWKGEPQVGLLPGSRVQEVERMLPLMLAAARLVEQKTPEASFLVPAASEAMAGLARDIIAGSSDISQRVEVVEGATRDVLQQARAAWVASGTATIEALLMRCPSLVVYKTSPLFYHMARAFIRVPYIGMVNILAGRAVCPEFIQAAATPEALSAALQPLLAESDERADMLRGMEETAARLGTGGAADRAAAALLEELG